MATPYPVIWALRTLVWFSLVAVGLVLLARWLPAYLNRAQVPPDFDDIAGLTPMSGVWLTAPPFLAGDVVAFRTGDGPEDISFGFVAALPGNEVRITGSTLQVDGTEPSNWKTWAGYHELAEVGPLAIPANHLYVISTQHQRDSLSQGVIGPDVILGKVRE
jgi:hypothetical protein